MQVTAGGRRPCQLCQVGENIAAVAIVAAAWKSGAAEWMLTGAGLREGIKAAGRWAGVRAGSPLDGVAFMLVDVALLDVHVVCLLLGGDVREQAADEREAEGGAHVGGRCCWSLLLGVVLWRPGGGELLGIAVLSSHASSTHPHKLSAPIPTS